MAEISQRGTTTPGNPDKSSLRSSQEAEEREALLLTTLHSIGDAVIVTDDRGHITLMNPLAERLTGWTEAEAVGTLCGAVFQSADETTGQPIEDPTDGLRDGGALASQARPALLTARDGTVVPIEQCAAPIRDRAGNRRGVALIFRDISERRRQERALRESEARFRAVLDNAPPTIYVKDREGRYTFVNHAFAILNACPAETAIGKKDVELFPPALCEPILANDRMVLDAGEVMQIEETGRFDGRTVTYLSTKFPLRDADGNICGLCGFSTNITEQKQVERTRRFLAEASTVLASSLDYEQTLEQVAQLAVPEIADWCSVDMWDEESGAIRQLAVAHVDPAKVKWARDLRKLYPPDLSEGRERGLARVLRAGESEIYTHIPDELLVAVARDEQHLRIMREIGFRSVITVPIIARGRVMGAITLVTTEESGHSYTPADLTLAEGLAARAALAIDNARLYRAAQDEIRERRRIEEALRASEERFRLALASSDIGVYSMDHDLRYTWAYSGKRSRELREIYGKTDAEILEPEDAARLTEIKRRVLETGAEERQIVRAAYIGQEERFFDTAFIPQHDADGNRVGIIGTVTDVTERTRTQEALAQHQAEIEALNHRLQRSMRETHHRVKNNLQVITALVGLQQMQYETAVPAAEMARLTQHIQALAFIHDLLTQQARTDAEVTTISVRAMMEKLMTPLRGMAVGRPLTYAADDLLLPVRQSSAVAVLVNELISNAMKHGRGAVHVHVRAEGKRAHLEVEDAGPGFPAAFDPAHAAHTGLDLISSLAQVDLNGRVRFENRPEGGARVVVEFPAVAVESAALAGD